jgi:hypothetical protein
MDNCISAATLPVVEGLLFESITAENLCAACQYVILVSSAVVHPPSQHQSPPLSYVCVLFSVFLKERNTFFDFSLLFGTIEEEKRNKKKGGLYIMVC